MFRGAPVLAHIAAAAGIEARFFNRDENKDIMAEFLKDGEYESIPVAVFYTKDHENIAHWIERPALANQEMNEKLGPMYARLRKPDMTDRRKRPRARKTSPSRTDRCGQTGARRRSGRSSRCFARGRRNRAKARGYDLVAPRHSGLRIM